MSMRFRAAVYGFMLLAAAAATADEPSPRPVGVQLSLSPETLRMVFTHRASGWLSAPPNPPCTVAVGEQTRDAYLTALGRMFRSSLPAAAALEVSITTADVDGTAEDWTAEVKHLLVLRRLSGEEVGRWTIESGEPIVGFSENAIPLAFARAAARAAARFERSFETEAGVARWLREQGIDPQTPSVAAFAADPPLPSPAPALPRGQLSAYLDGGAGFVTLGVPSVDGYSPSQEDLSNSLAIRAGISNTWGFAQLAGSEWSSDIGWQANVLSLGLDAGPLLRLGSFELASGLGFHGMWADKSSTNSTGSVLASQIVISALVAARMVRMISPRAAVRFSLELRHYFDASLQWGTEPKLEPSNTFLLLIGAEWSATRR